jgi:serpin B
MGMTSMFDASSTLDRIAHTNGVPQNVTIDFILHQAVIRVDEEGTEAAAATGVSKKSIPVKFNANRPFLYMLRSSSTIYFMGQFTGNGIN